jgi:hypothetical protein
MGASVLPLERKPGRWMDPAHREFPRGRGRRVTGEISPAPWPEKLHPPTPARRESIPSLPAGRLMSPRRKSGWRTRRNISLPESRAAAGKRESPFDEAGNLPGRSRELPRLGQKGISSRKERPGPSRQTPARQGVLSPLSLPALPQWKNSGLPRPERGLFLRGRRLHLVWPMIPSTSQSIFPRLSVDQNSPAFTLSAPLLSLIGPAKTSFLPSTKTFLVSFTSFTAS